MSMRYEYEYMYEYEYEYIYEYEYEGETSSALLKTHLCSVIVIVDPNCSKQEVFSTKCLSWSGRSL